MPDQNSEKTLAFFRTIKRYNQKLVINSSRSSSLGEIDH